MSILDPFARMAGGPLHRADIAVAERITGVRGRSVSRHLVQPAVRNGADPSAAVAVLHWALIGAVLVGGASLAMLFTRRRA